MVKNKTVITKDEILATMENSIKVLKRNWIVLPFLIAAAVCINIFFGDNDYMLYINIMFIIVFPTIIISNILTHRRISLEKNSLPDLITYDYSFRDKEFSIHISDEKNNRIVKVKYENIFNYSINGNLLIMRTVSKTLYSVCLDNFETEEDKLYVITKLNGGKVNGRS